MNEFNILDNYKGWLFLGVFLHLVLLIVCDITFEKIIELLLGCGNNTKHTYQHY